MKKLLIIFNLLLGIQILQAQTLDNPGTPEERAEKMTAKMQEELSLTAEQLPKAKALNLKYAKIMQKEVIEPDLNSWAMYNKGTKINKKKEVELKPLLNAAQWEKYEKMRASAMSNMWSKLF